MAGKRHALGTVCLAAVFQAVDRDILDNKVRGMDPQQAARYAWERLRQECGKYLFNETHGGLVERTDERAWERFKRQCYDS